MLIIEDGTGKPDAESYATAQQLSDYAMRFGAVIPADDTAREALLRRAALGMEAMDWKGRRFAAEQALAWPRRGIRIDREDKPDDYLPLRIREGQMALAVEIHADDLSPVATRKGAVVRERVEGAVEREYAVLDARQLCATAENPSSTHFSQFIERRRLFAVRA